MDDQTLEYMGARVDEARKLKKQIKDIYDFIETAEKGAFHSFKVVYQGYQYGTDNLPLTAEAKAVMQILVLSELKAYVKALEDKLIQL